MTPSVKPSKSNVFGASEGAAAVAKLSGFKGLNKSHRSSLKNFSRSSE